MLPKQGDRIVLTDTMANDPDPIPVGTEGTVTMVHQVFDYHQISVAWDNGRTLGLVVPPDRIRVIS